MGFNASFAILKKGIISRANVFKCGRRTKVPPQLVPLRVSDSKWYHQNSIIGSQSCCLLTQFQYSAARETYFLQLVLSLCSVVLYVLIILLMTIALIAH